MKRNCKPTHIKINKWSLLSKTSLYSTKPCIIALNRHIIIIIARIVKFINRRTMDNNQLNDINNRNIPIIKIDFCNFSILFLFINKTA